MELIQTQKEPCLTATEKAQLFSLGEQVTPSVSEIQVEHSMDVWVNEMLTMRIVCTPTHLPELILGRLFSEGMIGGVDEVESISVYASSTRARVFLKNRSADLGAQHIHEVPTCCTGNKLLNSYFDGKSEPVPVTPISWEPEHIYGLSSHFEQDSPLHRTTMGAHSCYLARGGEVLFSCEDLGRHNALDKAVGWGLANGIDLTECTVFSSGRLPADMVLKVVRSGIPVLVTKATPTTTAVELAQEYGLTLICKARPDSFLRY